MLNYSNLAKIGLAKYKRWSKAKNIKPRHLAQLTTQIFITEKLLEENERLSNELHRYKNAFSELNLTHALVVENWKNEINENQQVIRNLIKLIEK